MKHTIIFKQSNPSRPFCKVTKFTLKGKKKKKGMWGPVVIHYGDYKGSGRNLTFVSPMLLVGGGKEKIHSDNSFSPVCSCLRVLIAIKIQWGEVFPSFYRTFQLP